MTALLLTQSLGGLSSATAATFIVLIRRRSKRRTALLVLGMTVVAVGVLLMLRPELSQLSYPRNSMALLDEHHGHDS